MLAMLTGGQVALLLVVVVVVVAVEVTKEGRGKKRGLVTGVAGTKRFTDLCDQTFEQFDLDGSGDVCPTEAYAMVLYIYIKINKLVTVCPPTKEQCDALFKHFDLDDVRKHYY